LNNVLAGVITFLATSSLYYATWNNVISWLSNAPTELFLFCSVAWITMGMVGMIILPYIMLVSDDKVEG
jgi:hypothetical protein